MKPIIVTFDSLNRHFLPPFGCDSTHAPTSLFLLLGQLPRKDHTNQTPTVTPVLV